MTDSLTSLLRRLPGKRSSSAAELSRQNTHTGFAIDLDKAVNIDRFATLRAIRSGNAPGGGRRQHKPHPMDHRTAITLQSPSYNGQVSKPISNHPVLLVRRFEIDFARCYTCACS